MNIKSTTNGRLPQCKLQFHFLQFKVLFDADNRIKPLSMFSNTIAVH